MIVKKLVQRNLTETEEKTIAHFRYYFDDRTCFALIGDYAIALLDPSRDPEQLAREASGHMAQLLHTPPDFRTYVMDDRFGLVSMDFAIYGVSPEELSVEEIESEHMNVGTALLVRTCCLEACETGRVLAVCALD